MGPSIEFSAKRLPDWEERLDRTLQQFHIPFKWGQNDCVMLVSAALKAVTGVDPAAKYRGQYHNAKGAKRLLCKDWGGSIETYLRGVCQELGLQEVSPSQCGRGDIVLVPMGNDPSCGVVDLSGRKVALVGESGLERYPLTSATVGWRVG